MPKNNYDNIIIFSHDNGYNIYTFYEYLKLMTDNLGVMIVIYDYPSYGLSTGELNEFIFY